MNPRPFPLIALLVGAAHAQTWAIKDGTLTFIGCSGAQDGIYCEFRYVLTGKQVSSVFWNNDFIKVFSPGGSTQPADKVAFADSIFGLWTSKLDVLANTPLKVQAYFNLPNSTTALRAIEIAGKRFENISVRKPGSAAPVAAAPPVGLAAATGYSIQLSHCVPQGAYFVCTATLTPTR